jgi:hypothetical protein
MNETLVANAGQHLNWYKTWHQSHWFVISVLEGQSKL